ncbi:MAG: class I SAM-dependent methyltransferase [Rubritalea sp.]|uniref:class I SAM-dependent methyltransferase n=1 Tax=Rubritalea sp. TaxID=2109375 RepID=UPI0032427B4F
MYKDLEARLHDIFWNNEPDADESHLLEKFLLKYPGKALELGCGSGRLLLPLLQKGYNVEGVEISKDMLALLQREAQKMRLCPQVYLADISQHKTSTQYDAITIPAFTLQLFSRDAALSTLIKLRGMACEGAGLYITVFIPWPEILDALEPDAWHPDKETTLSDGTIARCKTRHQIDRTSQSLSRDQHYTISDNSNTILEEQYVHQDLEWYLLPELILMLNQSRWKFDGYDADFSLGNKDSDASLLTLYASAV